MNDIIKTGVSQRMERLRSAIDILSLVKDTIPHGDEDPTRSIYYMLETQIESIAVEFELCRTELAAYLSTWKHD